MEQTISVNQRISRELGLNDWQVDNVVGLLEGSSTIPFISRYRKEMTGSLDEVMLTKIRDRQEQLVELEKRRTYILKTIEGQDKLTPDLKKSILEADTLTGLEDLYLPYKPKRRTKATVAREKGLEPLASILFEQKPLNLEQTARAYINPEKEVADTASALAGARDIMAEWISEDPVLREMLRKLFFQEGILTSKVIRGKETEGAKYRDYFDFTEPVKKIPSHRMLAIRRGEKEMFLSVDIQPEETVAYQRLEKALITGRNDAADQVILALHDAYKRLLKPSLENEVRVETKKTADQEAIHVFSENLRQLLLAAPLGRKRILALDPGFRTGCKVVCLDEQGKLIYHTAIFPHEPQRRVEESSKVIRKLVSENRIEAVAIGNGTAGRETETFIRSLGLPPEIAVVMVNESGASVYSASEVAREEFPDEDVTVRGAVSIGRRLMDPLAELVKIDPKSIGVGQYQHDVDQGALKKSLDDVVVSCVNAVGVELNTASREILSYVSGLGPQLASNIVNFRNENGPFLSREDLKKVSRMGEKAFEQCAGFLRIRDGRNPLDGSAVHPERYDLVKKMAADLGCTVRDLLSDGRMRERISLNQYVSGDVGLPTLKDILEEMGKPGRDPRSTFEVFEFNRDITDISDLRPGMVIPGIITNITKFGAFVDVGVHQDGLVHVSQLADRYVSDPAEVVRINQQVTVKVVEVDVQRKRISLSMKSGTGPEGRKEKKPQKEDMKSKLDALKGKFR